MLLVTAVLCRSSLFSVSVIQLSKIERLRGSTWANRIPIPALSRAWTTVPWAAKVIPACDIRMPTLVPLTKGVVVSTKHPQRLRSSVCAET